MPNHRAFGCRTRSTLDLRSKNGCCWRRQARRELAQTLRRDRPNCARQSTSTAITHRRRSHAKPPPADTSCPSRYCVGLAIQSAAHRRAPSRLAAVQDPSRKPIANQQANKNTAIKKDFAKQVEEKINGWMVGLKGEITGSSLDLKVFYAYRFEGVDIGFLNDISAWFD